MEIKEKAHCFYWVTCVVFDAQVRLSAQQWGIEDIYRVPVGIRTVEWNNTSILINGRPIYLRGFGRHEDSDVS